MLEELVSQIISASFKQLTAWLTTTMDIVKNAYQALCKYLAHVFQFLQTVMFIYLEINQSVAHVFRDIELVVNNASL